MTALSEHYLIAKPCDLCHRVGFHLAFITKQTVTLTCTLCGYETFPDNAKRDIDYYASTRKDIDIIETKRLMEDTAQKRKSEEYKNLSQKQSEESIKRMTETLERHRKQRETHEAVNIPTETSRIDPPHYKNAFQEGIKSSETKTHSQGLIRATLLAIITVIAFFNSWPLPLKIGVFVVLLFILGAIGSSKKFRGKV